MRRLIPLVLALGALATIAFPAAAAKPDRYPTPYDDLVLQDTCAFDVLIEITLDRTHGIDFFDRDGNLLRTQYAGSLRIRATNMESDASVDLKVSGPASDVYNADGSITTTFLGQGLPLLTDSNLTSGRFEFQWNADFTEVTATQTSGFTQDLCALID